MRRLIPTILFLMMALTACSDTEIVTVFPPRNAITPTRPPIILSPTPIFIYPTTSASLPPPPSLTPSLTLTPGPTATFTLSPTLTETLSPTPTFTSTPEPLVITLLGCDTGIDVTHGMGEVTNAYIIIANHKGVDLSNPCATLSAADEGRIHPDKTVCADMLPHGFQITLKLTIDTTFRINTIVQVRVVSDQGITASTGKLACGGIGASKPAPEEIGVLQPIQLKK